MRIVTRMYMLMVVVIFVCLGMYSLAFAGEEVWQLIGKSSDNKAILSIDMHSITVLKPDFVGVTEKREPSPERIAELKKEFDESVKKSEEETGTKVEDPDGAFDILVKNAVRTIDYIFGCKNDTYQPVSNAGINFVFTVPPDGAERSIKDIVCKKAESEKRGVGESEKP
jgi:hypothetical protein